MTSRTSSATCLTRRQFLGRLGATTAALALGEPRARAATPSVVVIGGGLSGLGAALELSDAGFDVTVLEAQSRAGGRVFTLRAPFASGLYADAGAARIPSNHDLTLRYARRFNLTTVPFYPTSGKFLDVGADRAKEIDWKKFADRIGDAFGVQLGKPGAWSRIDGGNDLLPAALARALGERVLFEAPVSRVSYDHEGARVAFTRRGATETRRADYVVCTVPVSVLDRIAFEPPLPAARRAAIAEVSYTAATRVFLQCRKRIWERPGSRGYGIIGSVAELWPTTLEQSGSRGVLQGYYRGAAARGIDRLAETERSEALLAAVAPAFPGIREQFEGGASKSWHDDEWARGAWAHSGPQVVAAIRAPEGRIHFAGDHTSSHASWMQGALESGLRAAEEIVSRVRIASPS